MMPVLVVWRDAHADQNAAGWVTVDGLCDDDQPFIVRSVGWLLQVDGNPAKPGHVSVAQSQAGDPDCLVDSVLHVPVENVVKVQRLVPEL